MKEKFVSDDVINIIKNHHEGRGDDSYPKKIPASSLSNPSRLFNVCHDFSVELIKSCFSPKKTKLIFATLERR